jgi:hypothetical protein
MQTLSLFGRQQGTGSCAELAETIMFRAREWILAMRHNRRIIKQAVKMEVGSNGSTAIATEAHAGKPTLPFLLSVSLDFGGHIAVAFIYQLGVIWH